MIYPNFSEEKKLWKQGFNVVVGLDEAGRGPLAGPVVAAAIIFEKNQIIKYFHTSKYSSILNIRDSKKLSEKQREYFYGILTNHPAVEWGVGIVSEKIIDNINILRATKLSMNKAVDNLNSKLQITNYKNVDFLLLDGNFTLNLNEAAFAKKGYSMPKQKSIIKGDQKVFSISAASIIAKVTRDRIMQKMHKKYPEYGFNLHKGYGTALHVANLQKFGPSKIHRKTFFPVRDLA